MSCVCMSARSAPASRLGEGLVPLVLTGRGITLGAIKLGSRADCEVMNRAIEIIYRGLAPSE